MNVIRINMILALEKKDKIDSFQVREQLFNVLEKYGYKIDKIDIDYIRKESER